MKKESLYKGRIKEERVPDFIMVHNLQNINKDDEYLFSLDRDKVGFVLVVVDNIPLPVRSHWIEIKDPKTNEWKAFLPNPYVATIQSDYILPLLDD